MSEPGASRLLTRLSFRRFLDNDLLSPSGDGRESAVFALALLAAVRAAAFAIFAALRAT